MSMHAAHLTREQRRQILERLQPTAGYLLRLARRMQRRGWHTQDPAYVAAWKAHEQLVSLCMALHYAGTGQAWEPPEEPPLPGSPPPPLKQSGEGKNGKLRNTFRNRAGGSVGTTHPRGGLP